MTFRNIILGISGILLFAGCHDIPFFTQYHQVNTEAWASKDFLIFKLPEVEHAEDYDVKVAVRTIQTYKYGNLSLVLRTYEDKNLISTDTVSYKIYGENGEQKGTGFPFVEHEMPLQHTINFLPQKKYKIKISHIMRLDPLDGVSDVGISVGN